jgi:hypothetical protein
MKKLLFASLLFVSACILMAQESKNVGEFRTETYQVNQRLSVVITGYTGTSKQIYIPAQIGGLPVAGIGNGAFRSRRIESVTFPSTLVFIGDYAFYDNNLTDISIPSTVINIGVGAFDNNVCDKYYSSKTTYVRTFTIEPTHSETVYQPKQSPSAQEKVNVIVVPGYNPMPSSTRTNNNIVTVPQNRNPSSVVTVEPIARSNQTSQQFYGDPQVYERQLPHSSNSRFNIIPEGTSDFSSVNKNPVKKEELFKLHLTERNTLGHIPAPQ